MNMPAKKLELISFKLCPFVQRAVIVLKCKDVDFDVVYIDIQNPPSWFKEISPLGLVPILKVGKDVLFESAVIQEYLDEITLPSLQPRDLLKKAKNKAWISFGSDILFALHALQTTRDKALFDEKKSVIQQKLKQLETEHSGDLYFNGPDINMIDAAYAPLLMRLRLLQQLTGIDLLEDTPKLQSWADEVLAQECVQNSVVPDFAKLFKHMIRNADGLAAAALQEES